MIGSISSSAVLAWLLSSEIKTGDEETVLAISMLYTRVRESGTLADKPCSGAPPVTIVRQDNYICQRHLRDRFLTAESTCSEVIGVHGVPVSRYTVRNCLLEQRI